jgi:hypothetical protein
MGKVTPDVSDVHRNAALTNLSIAQFQDPALSFSRRVFPAVPSSKQSDAYFIWNAGDLNRDTVTRRAPGGAYPNDILNLSQDTFLCDLYHEGALIPREQLANEDAAVRSMDAATMAIANKFMIRKDRDWAAKCFTTGIWTGSTTGADVDPGDEWNDLVNGDPIGDIKAQVRSIQKKGFVSRRHIKLVIGPAVADALMNHPSIIARYENTTEVAQITEEQLAKVFDIGEVIVGETAYNTAATGLASVGEFVLEDDNALLVYAAPSPGILVPSAGYTFEWTDINGTGNGPVNVESVYIDERKSWQLMGDGAWDHKVVAPTLGAMFINCLT